MRQILKSYLKLFISSWLETLGTLLFLITFIIVILSMLPAPLQISLMANQTNKKTNQWDYSVQLDAEKIKKSNVSKNEVYDFSSEFMQTIAMNFLEGNVIADKYIEDGDIEKYALTSSSGDVKYVSFEHIEKTKPPVGTTTEDKSLFGGSWFPNAKDAIIKIIDIEEEMSQDKTEENGDVTRKYIADVFKEVAAIFENSSLENTLGESSIKWLSLQLISKILGYDFEFDAEWTSDVNKVKKDAYEAFQNAFENDKVANIFDQSVLNYYHLDGAKEDTFSVNEPKNLHMYRNIWSAIQTNVYEQLMDQGVKLQYTRENSIYTLANIGDQKAQAVNFTEIYDSSTENKRINNIVRNKKEFINESDNLQNMNVFANDKFINTLNKFDNKFTANGVDIKLNETFVAYKLNGITSKNDPYNYSMFSSKSAYTGELYIREKTFNTLYDALAKRLDDGVPAVPATEKQALKLKTIFYLKLDDNNISEIMSYLFGDVSNVKQNIFAIDTKNIYTKNASPQLKMITMVNLMTIIYSVIGLILLFLATIFMLYSQKEELNRTRKQLGVFKSNGYKTWELATPATLKVFILMFAGLFLGYLFSFPLQMNAVDKQFGSIGVFQLDRIYANPIFLLVLLFIVPFIFTLIIFLVLLKFLSEKPLDLMRTTAQSNYIKHPWWYWVAMPIIFPFVLLHKLSMFIFKRTRLSFTFRLQGAFLSMSKGKFTIVMILFSFATFLVAMEMKAMPVMNNMFNEATAYLNNDTDHESTMIGDWEEQTEEGNTFNTNSFTGRQFIDLDGKNVEDFLKKQKALSIDDKNRVLDDFVFNVTDLVDELFQTRIKVLNAIDNIPDPKVKDDAMKLTSLFAIGALVLPVDFASSVEDYKKITFEFIKVIQNNQQISKKVIIEYINDIKALANESESLLTTKLSDSFDQIFKAKAIQTNDIFKITWMLFSGWLEDSNIAKLDSISDIKKYISDEMNNPLAKSNKASNDGSIEDIIKWIEKTIKEIVEFVFAPDNMFKIENIIKNSNFIQKLLPPLLLTKDGYNPLITNNSIVFDSKKETLIRHSEIRIEGHNFYSTMMTFDSTGKFGDLRNQYIFDGILNWNNLKDVNNDGTINVIVSKPIAKMQNVKIGDTIAIHDRYSGKNKKPLIGRIIGIQVRNIAVHTVYADYNRAMSVREIEGSKMSENKYDFRDDDGTIYPYENVYSFDKMISKKKKVDLPLKEIGMDFSEIVNSFTFTQDTFSYMTNVKNQKNIYWFTSMIVASNYLSKQFTDTEMKKKISSTSSFNNIPNMFDAAMSYEIIKAGASVMIDMITNMMIVNIIISLVLLLILFTVLIKIIIHDAQGIIILMRSLGYKDIQINWIVMGKYLTSSIWVFIIMYILSMLTWTGIAGIAWNKYAIILAIPVIWYLPFVIFLVMESVIAIGFLFGVYRLKKLPLARL